MRLADAALAGGGAFSDRRSKSALRGRTNREDTAAIREWARAHGHKVNDRGRNLQVGPGGVPGRELIAFVLKVRNGRLLQHLWPSVPFPPGVAVFSSASVSRSELELLMRQFGAKLTALSMGGQPEPGSWVSSAHRSTGSRP